MAVADCIRECRHCGATFQRTDKGQPTKYCGSLCRDAARGWKGRRKTHRSGVECSVPGCEGISTTKGYCPAHYARVRTGRSLEHPVQRNGDRTEKACGCCGNMMVLKPSIAAKQTYCSRACSRIDRAARMVSFPCGWCCKRVTRSDRKSRDRGMYCSKDCGCKANGRVRTEVSKLAMIAKAWASPSKVIKPCVKREVEALKRIRRYVERPALYRCSCAECGTLVVRKVRVIRACCKACNKRRNKHTSRLSPSRKIGKRIYKARRRALERGLHADRIDPIRVFERDRWKCHLCGVKTLKSLRGKYEPRTPELDHVVPLALGGSHTWGNVRCSCRACNGAKGATAVGQLGFNIAA